MQIIEQINKFAVWEPTEEKNIFNSFVFPSFWDLWENYKEEIKNNGITVIKNEYNEWKILKYVKEKKIKSTKENSFKEKYNGFTITITTAKDYNENKDIKIIGVARLKHNILPPIKKDYIIKNNDSLSGKVEEVQRVLKNFIKNIIDEKLQTIDINTATELWRLKKAEKEAEKKEKAIQNKNFIDRIDRAYWEKMSNYQKIFN